MTKAASSRTTKPGASADHGASGFCHARTVVGPQNADVVDHVDGRHADSYWFCVHLVVVFGVYSDGIGAFRTHFPGFRHADGTLDFQRFRASLRPAGCAIAGSRVSLSLAAQHGGLAPGDWGGLLVRWWFENSRAYLYYFFIVNDCQFVAGHGRSRSWCRGIGQTAARFLCDAPFLIRRSSIFLFRESSCRCLFMKRFFCGGFDSGSG